MKTYSEKLKDPLWQRKRLKILEIHQFKCDLCNDTRTTLHVHHQYYVSGRDPWEYPDFALSVLCKDCHSLHHNSELATLPFERILDNFGCKNPSQIANTEEVSDYAKSCINRSSVDSFHEWLHYAVGEHHIKISKIAAFEKMGDES